MINDVILLGRLASDPELRTTSTGKDVCSFRLAVERSYVPQGEQRKADFIPCVAWSNTGRFVSNYFRKGNMIAVAGSLQTREYEDKSGQKRTAYEVIVREASFTGNKTNETHNEYQAVGDYSTDFEEV